MVKVRGLKRPLYDGLFGAMVSNDPKARSILDCWYSDIGSWERRFAWIKTNYNANRRQLAALLVEYNRSLGADERALDNAAALADPNCVVIVSGHQPCVCGGPMFLIAKVLTELKLCKEMSFRLNCKVVPVFWVASEDHDFDEVRSIKILTADGELVKCGLHEGPGAPVSIGPLRVSEGAVKLVAEVESALSGHPFANAAGDLLRSCMGDNVTIGEWFGKLLSKLFSRFGLVLLDPMIPELREMSAPVFKTALEKFEEFNGRVGAGIEMLMQAEFEPKVAIKPGQLPLFRYVNSERRLLLSNGSVIKPRGLNVSWKLEELADAINASPQEFSPNVLLRPILQDTILPSVAYVGGPTEVNYVALLKHAYALFGIKQPIIYPRLNFTLVSPEIFAMLDRIGFSELDKLVLELDEASLIEKALERHGGAALKAQFELVRERFEEAYDSLKSFLLGLDEKLEPIIDGNLERIMAQVEYLEKKSFQKLRHREKLAVSEAAAAFDWLKPNNQPQERELSLIWAIAVFGFDWIEELLETIPLSPEHLLVEIS